MKHFIKHFWLLSGLLLILATAGCFRSAGGADEPPLSPGVSSDTAPTSVAVVPSETPTETIIEFTPEFTPVVDVTDTLLLPPTETATEAVLFPLTETPTTEFVAPLETATQEVALLLTETPTVVFIAPPTETPTSTATEEIFFAATMTATEAFAALATPTPEQDIIFPTSTPTSFLAPTATEANSGIPALQETTPNQSQIDATNIIASATQVFINQTLTAQAVQVVPTIPPFTATIDPTLLPPGQVLFTPTPAPILSGADCVHEVVLGENLFRLSLRYGVGVADIARSSGITNINLIFVGQKLVIPGCGTTGVVPPATTIPSGELGTGGPLPGTGTGTGSGRIHTVQQYETLFQISLIYGVPINSIASANGISNINVIYIGQELVIP